jgi:1,4-dihydroxy-2-naphthoate octaprenyltransferase
VTNRWVLGARPRTLPAAVVPVVVGTGVASVVHSVVLWKAGLALVVSLALQVATNYVNDYADGERGTDDNRVGPVRLVGGGLASASAVKRAALLAFVVAGVAGIVLALTTAWWLVLVGAACVVAAYAYTGGSKPYGYYGLGELFVFVCFGLVATAGTAYVQTERYQVLALDCGVAVGLFATALLVVNNLRDIPGDTASAKRTLAVRLGDARTRTMYGVLLAFAFVLVLPPICRAADSGYPLLAAAALPFVLPPIDLVLRRGAKGPALIPVLGMTSRAQLAFGLLLTLGLVLVR